MPANLNERFNKVSPTTLTTFCYRIVREEFDPLSTDGSMQISGRYNIKGKFGVLYAGESQAVCEAEILRKTCGLPTKFKYKLAKLKVSFKKVLDLTDKATLKALKINESQLIDEDHTLTQKIAYFAYHNGYEALIAPSTTNKGNTIVLFPDNFAKKSSLKKTLEKSIAVVAE